VNPAFEPIAIKPENAGDLMIVGEVAEMLSSRSIKAVDIRHRSD
jgi:hypothetical protein